MRLDSDMANSWFRMYGEFLNDPKVQMLSEVNQRRLIMVFCLRCNGHVTLQDEEVAFQLRISETELEETKALFIQKGFIDDCWNLLNWEKRQDKESLRPSSEAWRRIRERIFARDDYTCQYCFARGVRLECDHIIPVSRGGGHEDSNLATACFGCNRSKHAKLPGEWGRDHG